MDAPAVALDGPAVLDLLELRRAFGCYLTGVTIVTTMDEAGVPRGFTANSFTSVSLDPPLILVCIAKNAGSHLAFVASGAFGVNILQQSQRPLSKSFASRAHDKFVDIAWDAGKTGSPRLPDCAAWIDCRTHDRIDAGDHTILIGRVIDVVHSPNVPLGFHAGGYIGISAAG